MVREELIKSVEGYDIYILYYRERNFMYEARLGDKICFQSNDIGEIENKIHNEKIYHYGC